MKLSTRLGSFWSGKASKSLSIGCSRGSVTSLKGGHREIVSF